MDWGIVVYRPKATMPLKDCQTLIDARNERSRGIVPLKIKNALMSQNGFSRKVGMKCKDGTTE